MDPLLMSETQYKMALTRGNFADRNNSLLGIDNPIDTNGNMYGLGNSSCEGTVNRGDMNLNGSASSLPGLSNASRGVSFIEVWSNNMNNSNRVQDSKHSAGTRQCNAGKKRSYPSTPTDDMITFSPPASPECDHLADHVFMTSLSNPTTVPAPEDNMGMCSLSLNPPATHTSLVLTAPTPSPSPGPSVSVSTASTNFQRYNMLVPHQSNNTNPFWFPTPSTARTMRSIEQDGTDSLKAQQSHLVPDLRSIASGALVDIEVPSSYSGSAVSVTGSQATLLTNSSPYKKGSMRRSFSADSLFGGKSCFGGGEHPFNSAVPLAVLPGKAQCPTDDSYRLAMKRTTSLDQLRRVMPFPMPPPCMGMDSKVAEMVRSMSMEERASLALSMDEPICRICWGGVENEEVIQPCYCNTHVHMTCIQRWLGVAKITYCEVCRYQYKAYRKMKPLSEWRWWPHKNRHLAQLEATVILLGVVTPPLLCGIILCSQKIAEYLRTPDNAWKTAGLMTLVMVSVGTYLGAILYFCHKFATVCHIWVNSNRTTVVTVVPLTLAERRPKLDPCRVWAIS